MFSFFILFFYGLFAFFCYKKFLKNSVSEETIHFQSVCNDVHCLENLVLKLETLEEIITDLEASDENLLRNVTISVPSSVGDANNYEMLIGNADYTREHLLETVYSERERIRASLLEGIEKLYYSGITKTVTKAMGDMTSEVKGEQL